MVSLVNYKGLQILSPAPTVPPGDGGLAIQDNFTNLVDWQPYSVWNETTSPTPSDDETGELLSRVLVAANKYQSSATLRLCFVRGRGCRLGSNRVDVLPLPIKVAG